MTEPEIIELKLSKREAHVVLRALASHDEPDDAQPCTWVAERLLRILSPELGLQPLAAIHAVAASAAAGPRPVRRKRGETK